MNVKGHIDQYTNYPVLFVGSGFSKRYSTNARNWIELLKEASSIIYENTYEYDQLYEEYRDKENPLSFIAKKQEDDFTQKCNTRETKYAYYNEIWDAIEPSKRPSRYKILIAKLINEIEIHEYKGNEDHISLELKEFIETSKNIMSFITTNYDNIIEQLLTYTLPIIGNDIFFSCAYGTVYKIHGDASSEENFKNIIITNKDYEKFDEKFELIKAHLLSLFIHHPIIFIGYSIEDENIRKLLATIFKYVDLNSEEGKKIRDNFLLVEWDEGSNNEITEEHSIVVDGSTIAIRKIKTDNFIKIYKSISELTLTANGLEIKKIMNVMYEVSTKADKVINVNIPLDDNNRPLISGILLERPTEKAIIKGNVKKGEVIQEYFKIMEINDTSYREYVPAKNRHLYFPVWGFSDKFNASKMVEIEPIVKETLKKRYNDSLNKSFEKYTTMSSVFNDDSIVTSKKTNCCVYNIVEGNIPLEDVKKFLKENPKVSNYDIFLTLYDFCMYNSVIDLK